MTSPARLRNLPKPSPPHASRRMSFQPSVESLEGRCVPATLNVTPGQSIQAAINAANPGDTISISPGTYREALVITTSNLHLVAGDGDHDANDSGVTIDAPAILNNTTGALIDIVGAGHVEINDLVLNGLDYTFDSAIRVRASGSATIHYNTIENTFNGATNQLGYSIRVGDDGDVLGTLTPGIAKVDSNVLESYNKGGVIVDGTGSTATITNNTITGSGLTNLIAQNGLQVSNGAAGRLQENTVTHNNFNDPTGNIVALGVEVFNTNTSTVVACNELDYNDSGVEIQNASASKALVANNDVLDSISDGIILTNSSRVAVVNNYIDHGGGDGISLQGSNNNTIINNEANDSSAFGGIFLGSSNGNTLTGNDLEGNALDGIQLQDASNNVLNCNVTAANRQSGIEIDRTFAAGSSVSSSDSNLIVFDASATNILDGVLLNGASGTTIEANAIVANGRFGINVTNGSTNTTIEYNSIAANATSAINIDASSTATMIKCNLTFGGITHESIGASAITATVQNSVSDADAAASTL